MQTKKPKGRSLLEILMYAAVLIEGFVALPQVFDIFRNHDATNVSLVTWVGYEVLTVIWLAYAISIKDKPITLYSSICTLSQGAIIVGILLY